MSDVAEQDQVLEDTQGGTQDAADAAHKQYAHGAIKKIKVHDFMTYAGTVTITPGPRLNLILGPNGTGKSSLVCAICIGLGGKPTSLGRGDNLREFVRRGKSSCWTEVTLSGRPGERDTVIRRDITLQKTDDKASQHSKWRVNNVEKPAKEVEALIKGLNIQFDNLCQFLPQDRVVEFAKMNPQELLGATESALGDSFLKDLHDQLVELRKTQKQDELAHGNLSRRLEQLNTEQERNRRDFERFQQRQQLLEEVADLEKVKAWMNVAAAQAKMKELEKKKKAAAEELKRRQEGIQQDQTPIKQLEAKLKGFQQANGAATKRAMETQGSVNAITTHIAKELTAVDDTLQDIAGAKQRSEKHRQDLSRAQQEVVRITTELQSQPHQAPTDLIQQHRQLSNQARDIDMDIAELSQEKSTRASSLLMVDRNLDRVQHQLNQLGSEQFRRLMKLDSRIRGMRDMKEWVDEQRRQNRFKGGVWGPLLLEINVAPGADPQVAQFVEQQCERWLGNFIVEDKDDEALIGEEIRRRNLRGVLAGCFTEDYNRPISHPDGEAAAYARFGITHTLDQLIDAHPIVKHALASECKINSTYLGNLNAYRNAEEIFKQTRLRTFFHPEGKVSLMTSQYNKASRGLQYEDLRGGELLSGGSTHENDSERARLQGEQAACMQEKQQVEREIADMDSQIQELQRRSDVIIQQANQLKLRIDEVTKKYTQLSQAKLKLEAQLKVLQRQPDPIEQLPQLHEKVRAHAANIERLVTEELRALQSLAAVQQEAVVADLACREADMQLKAMKADAEERARSITEAQNLLRAAEQAHTAQKSEMTRLKAEVDAVYPLTSDEAKQAMMARVASFKDQEEVQEQIEAKQAEADAIMCNNANVANEFRTRQQQIDMLQKQTEQSAQALQTLADSIQEKKDRWLPTLKELVEQVNVTFSKNFAEIGCAGEVQLVESEDFDKFAIQIRVKFREGEDLQVLSANRQSGGERSVSTIMYLIALQGVTVTPFRVVDEINQGMDPINERKVFVQLVESSCQEGTPQCFLLTPKLLPGLPFTPDITVLEIFNGTQIEDGLPKAVNFTQGMFGSRVVSATA